MTTYEKKITDNKITQGYRDFMSIARTEDHQIDVITTLMQKVEVREESRLYRGFKPDFQESNWPVVMTKLFNFEKVWDWSNALREVFKNDDLKAIFTYCEGDLNIIVFDDKADYQDKLQSAGEFYAKGY